MSTVLVKKKDSLGSFVFVWEASWTGLGLHTYKTHPSQAT
jgi:hypothetical protein